MWMNWVVILPSILLLHSKVNYGRRERPFGLTIHHGEDGATWFSPGKIDDVVSASTARSLKDRIYATIKMLGKATVRELAQELEEPLATVRSTLYYMQKRDLVTKVGGGKEKTWALIAHESHV